MHPKKFLPVILAALLAAGGCSKSPEQVKAEKAKIEAETTGKLAVKSNRPNTTIEVTRIATPGDTTPARTAKGNDEGAAEQTLSALPAGKYTLTARSAGWPDLHQEATVAAGNTTAVAINFKSGSLRLDSDPSGAVVKLAGAVLGKTPLMIPQLPPGESPLSLEYPAWPATVFKAAITENVEATATVRLPHGKLTVESFPVGATVLLGKQNLGLTPLVIERMPPGAKKLTLQAKDFPALEVTATVEDRGEAKVSPQLGSGFPLLDPPALLRAVWVVDNPDQIAPPVDSVTGPYQPQNGIVKNLNRKRLYDYWLRKSYRFTGTVKVFDPTSGQVEFTEQNSDWSKYRVVAKLSAEARNDKDLAARVAKGATFSVYGRLSATEEPRWPGKIITLEISPAETLR